MKHIIKYGDWRVHESDQEMEDAERLAELGLIDQGELKSIYRQKYAVPRREEFLRKLTEMFGELEIQPIDYTTPRQRKNGTYFFQLTQAQAERILFDYPIPEGLSQKQTSRLNRMLQEIEPAREQLRELTELETWQNGPWSSGRSSRYQYFVYPSDLRGAAWDRHPSSSPHFKFDGSQTADSMLARFVYQVALDTHPYVVYHLFRDK